MIDVFPTSREPGRAFVDKMRKLEGKDGVLSVSLGHGFTQGDVPEQGTRVLVITDNAKAHGDALARELGAEIREQSAAPGIRPISPRRGDRLPPMRQPKGPIVVADPSDNAGGGAASDNTNIIRRLLERGMTRRRGRPGLGPGRGAVLPCRRRRRRRCRCASAARPRRPRARRSTPK